MSQASEVVQWDSSNSFLVTTIVLGRNVINGVRPSLAKTLSVQSMTTVRAFPAKAPAPELSNAVLVTAQDHMLDRAEAATALDDLNALPSRALRAKARG